MKKILSVSEVPTKPGDWPDYCVTSDVAAYIVDLGHRTAVVSPMQPGQRENLLPTELIGRSMMDLRHNDETSIVIELDDGTKLVFSISWNPFTEESWPCFFADDKDEAAKWDEEYRKMVPFWPISKT